MPTPSYFETAECLPRELFSRLLSASPVLLLLRLLSACLLLFLRLLSACLVELLLGLMRACPTDLLWLGSWAVVGFLRRVSSCLRWNVQRSRACQ